MAVAIPELPAPERQAIVRGVLGGMRRRSPGSAEQIIELRVPGVGSVGLSYQPGLVRPWGVRPERWRRGSDRWVSVTPVVLDRYPRKGDIEGEILRACIRIGLPSPSDVVVSSAPLMTGAVRMRPRDLPKQVHGRLFRHVALRFERRVAGPLLLGAGRYLGIGLLAPQPTSERSGRSSGDARRRRLLEVLLRSTR